MLRGKWRCKETAVIVIKVMVLWVTRKLVVVMVWLGKVVWSGMVVVVGK